MHALGPYQILDRIGSGGLGDVFRARDSRTGRTVVLKCPPAALAADTPSRQRLERQLAAAAAISHPHVAAVHETGEADGVLFVAMEHVPGETLARVVAGQPLHPRRAAEIAAQIADALAHAHAHGMVHGDLRPDNVMITSRGQVKVLELGSSPFTRGGAARAAASSVAKGGEVPVAPGLEYMSPEQALGARLDHRSDIFSLGVMLYEMLAGAVPFRKASLQPMLVSILHSTPPTPSSRNVAVPTVLDAIVQRALARSLDVRYQSAAELAADLRTAAAMLEPRAAPEASASPPATDTIGRRSVVWAAVAIGLAAAAMLVWMYRGAL